MDEEVTLTPAEIVAAMQNGGGTFKLGASQFTYSIPGASSVWSAYSAGEEPYNSYSTLSAGQAANYEAALGLWDELISPDFTEVADNASGSGELRVAFTAMGSGTAGYAYSGTPQAPGGKVGDVWLNSGDTGESYDSGTYGFTTLLHELGHTLGLKHSFTPPALPAEYDNGRFTVMAYNDAEQGNITTFYTDGGFLYSSTVGVVQVTPMVIDISAVQSIYGAETSTRSGNTVYSYNDDDGSVLRAIYDGGGTDTIDLSACVRDCEIDLKPGAYSSVGIWTVAEQTAYWQAMFPAYSPSFIAAQFDADSYEQRDNLGIALNTIIENATGGSGNDSLLGNDANNSLDGADGDDWLEGGLGNDVLDGGSGNDTVSYASAGAAINIKLGFAGARNTLGAGVDTFAGIENAIGSIYNDRIVGTNGANTLDGGDGNDSFTGADGDDHLLGGAGNDTLDGSAGNDTMEGGTGNDIYYLRQAGDVVVEAASSGTDTTRTQINYTLVANVENLKLLGSTGLTGTGNSLANGIQGSAGADTIYGLGGADEIFGNTGADTIYGGGAADIIWGGNSADTLYGDAGNDVLRGDSGGDTLHGGDANDRLRGDAGLDHLYGDAGADTFIFAEGHTSASRGSADVVHDFSHGEGDLINLSGIDAKTTVAGDQGFNFIGSAAFGNVAGQLHYVQTGGNTYVEGDTNGDSAADFSICFIGTIAFVGADFQL